MKDYEKALAQIEAVVDEIELALANNSYITITKACAQAKIPEYRIYRIIDNPADYNIPDTLLDRYNAARDYLFSQAIHRVRETGDYEGENRNSSDEANSERSSDDASENNKPSALKLGYAKLRADNEKWLLSKLLPRTLGEKQSQQALVDQSTHNTLVIDPQLMSPTQLKALASLKMIAKE